jgi:hypothetical protein
MHSSKKPRILKKSLAAIAAMPRFPVCPCGRKQTLYVEVIIKHVFLKIMKKSTRTFEINTQFFGIRKRVKSSKTLLQQTRQFILNRLPS